jgi:hypothetical protein
MFLANYLTKKFQDTSNYFFPPEPSPEQHVLCQKIMIAARNRNVCLDAIRNTMLHSDPIRIEHQIQKLDQDWINTLAAVSKREYDFIFSDQATIIGYSAYAFSEEMLQTVNTTSQRLEDLVRNYLGLHAEASALEPNPFSADAKSAEQ